MPAPARVRRSAGAIPLLPVGGVALRALLEPVRELLEGSIDAAVILDRERRVLYYNRAYEATCRLRGRELARRVADGARCYELFSLEVCASACVGCRAREARRPLRVDEIRAVRGDGEELTFIVSAVPLGDDYIVESYRDVTAEMRIQRRLKVLLETERRAKGDLEEMVEERTRELRQAQAQLVLQEKMSTLGRLVAGIAHELNNPINFVYGNVDFLAQYVEDLLTLVRTADESPDLSPALRAELDAVKQRIEFDYLVEDSHKLLKSIRTGAERTAAIVRDLKNFSRTGASDMVETDVVSGIETTLNLISPLHRDRISIERDYQAGLPRLVANAGHLNQVFMNLLANAAQAIRGPGTIRIAVTSRDEDGRPVIEVSISDTGEGMAPDVLERITDPFFTTKGVGEGTGLGLWITDSIVRAHGGTLLCESAVGAGSTFRVILPLRPRDE
ncbi:MAG TPA: ATP-binding protein [Kofleriaceae bacterium]|nr:ATP-binding protein [Kofleriaceae bacterium]